MKRFVFSAISALLLVFSGSARAPITPTPNVVVARLDGVVQPVSAEYIVRAIHYANDHRADAVVIELNTPGGLDSSMRQIIENIFASSVPVMGYVAPSGARAASAGFFILLSCDVAAMAPGTNTGAAHPVLIGGSQPDAVMSEKLKNDAAAYLRSIATQRHRNPALAETGVVQSKAFTEHEALDNKLIDLVAPSLPDLLNQISGREIVRLDGRHQKLQLAGAHLEDYAMTLRERILYMDPSLAFILLIAGAFCIGIEFTHPGAVLPGVVGAIAFVLALFVLSFLPINWAAAGLLLLSFALLILEAKFPSHGILAAGGVVSMFLGAILLVDSPVPELRIRKTVALGVALPLAGITVFLVRLVLKARRHKVVTGQEGLLGDEGVVKTGIAPEGMVLVHGDLWRARARQPLTPGTRIRVVGIRGLLLDVEPLESNGAGPSGALAAGTPANLKQGG